MANRKAARAVAQFHVAAGEDDDVATVEEPGKPSRPPSGKRTKRARVTTSTDDPQTWIGLIWRLTGDPARAFVLIMLLTGVAGAIAVSLPPAPSTWLRSAGATGASALLGAVVVAVRKLRARRAEKRELAQDHTKETG